MRIFPNKELRIGWIKAHIGLEGNERADTLAKSAISMEELVAEDDIKFSNRIVKKYYEKISMIEWQHDWEREDTGRDTYNVIKKVSLDYLCKSQIQAYYITGHGSFPSFLFKINKKDNPNCVCGKYGDVKHYLFGRCSEMKYHFDFHRGNTLRWNMHRILFDNDNYSKLKDNYNILNEKFSFIKYKF